MRTARAARTEPSLDPPLTRNDHGDVIPDAHCHLDQIPDPDRAAEEAAEAGVAPILAVSMDAPAAEAILGLRERHPRLVLAGIGLHPSRVAEVSPAEQERQLRGLEGLLPQADFSGEIGLDYKDALTETDRARQREALDLQLGWAARRGLPVNLHSRRADRDVLNVAIDFHERTGLGCLMHWFTHSRKLARLCVERGIFISPGPSILIDPRTAVVARAIGESILLLETDSPVRYGAEGVARPAWTARVLAHLARLRGTGVETLGRLVCGNLERYLGREPGRRPDREQGLL